VSSILPRIRITAKDAEGRGDGQLVLRLKFNVVPMRDEIKRIVFDLQVSPSPQRLSASSAVNPRAVQNRDQENAWQLTLTHCPLTSCAALYSSSCVESGDVAVGRRMSRARSKRFSGPIRPLTDVGGVRIRVEKIARRCAGSRTKTLIVNGHRKTARRNMLPSRRRARGSRNNGARRAATSSRTAEYQRRTIPLALQPTDASIVNCRLRHLCIRHGQNIAQTAWSCQYQYRQVILERTLTHIAIQSQDTLEVTLDVRTNSVIRLHVH
jgi:hypothetical protein